MGRGLRFFETLLPFDAAEAFRLGFGFLFHLALPFGKGVLILSDDRLLWL
jgi:hypothetical protein